MVGVTAYEVNIRSSYGSSGANPKGLAKHPDRLLEPVGFALPGYVKYLKTLKTITADERECLLAYVRGFSGRLRGWLR